MNPLFFNTLSSADMPILSKYSRDSFVSNLSFINGSKSGSCLLNFALKGINISLRFNPSDKSFIRGKSLALNISLL